jgi:hypothetical protein
MTEKKIGSVKETRTVMIPGDESGKKYTVEWAGGGNEPVLPEDKPKFAMRLTSRQKCPGL